MNTTPAYTCLAKSTILLPNYNGSPFPLLLLISRRMSDAERFVGIWGYCSAKNLTYSLRFAFDMPRQSGMVRSRSTTTRRSTKGMCKTRPGSVTRTNLPSLNIAPRLFFRRSLMPGTDSGIFHPLRLWVYSQKGISRRIFM